jgi:phage gpG-like protein
MTNFNFAIEDNVSPELAKLAARCSDLTPAFKDFGEFYLDKIDRQFQTETDPYSGSWTPLTAAYANYKAKNGFIPKILQKRGHMRARTSYAASPGQLAIGFNDNKARFHDKGTRRMAARQLLPDNRRGLPNDARDELTTSFAKYIP